jgi:hypothetical protein
MKETGKSLRSRIMSNRSSAPDMSRQNSGHVSTGQMSKNDSSTSCLAYVSRFCGLLTCSCLVLDHDGNSTSVMDSIKDEESSTRARSTTTEKIDNEFETQTVVL